MFSVMIPGCFIVVMFIVHNLFVCTFWIILEEHIFENMSEFLDRRSLKGRDPGTS